MILTRNCGYRKKKPGKSSALYLAAFKNYPNLLNTLLNRYRNYNRMMDLIDKWEQEGHIFVLRPQAVPVSRTEQNAKALTDFYQHGVELMKEKMPQLLEFLNSDS